MLVGYAPMILAALFVPGFWWGLWATIHVYFEIGATNLGKAVPWPWLVPHTGSVVFMTHYILTGVLLIAQPVFGLTVAGYMVWRSATRKIPLDPLIFASALLAIFYTHHAFAAPGLGHLAQAIFPMLICLFALVMTLPRRTMYVSVTAICAVSAFLLLQMHPLYYYWTHQEDFVATRIGDDVFHVNPNIARQAAVLTALADKYAPAGREFVAEPFLPAAYALVDRRAAVWNTYPNVPADADVQEAEIRRMQAERPGFVLISKSPYPYEANYPLVYAFILRTFVRTTDPLLPYNFGWELYIPAHPPSETAAKPQG